MGGRKMEEQKVVCPRCGSGNITFTREQSGSIGGAQNKVVITKDKSHGCLWWCCIGWWLAPCKALLNLCTLGLFKKKNRGGINLGAQKSFNHTVAVCQNCGNSWKVK